MSNPNSYAWAIVGDRAGHTAVVKVNGKTFAESWHKDRAQAQEWVAEALTRLFFKYNERIKGLTTLQDFIREP